MQLKRALLLITALFPNLGSGCALNEVELHTDAFELTTPQNALLGALGRDLGIMLLEERLDMDRVEDDWSALVEDIIRVRGLSQQDVPRFVRHTLTVVYLQLGPELEARAKSRTHFASIRSALRAYVLKVEAATPTSLLNLRAALRERTERVVLEQT